MNNEQAITVLEMIETHGSLPTKAKELAIKALKNERPKGKWKRINPNVVECTACQKLAWDISNSKMNYCPYCGAEMEECEKKTNFEKKVFSRNRSINSLFTMMTLRN